jgi:Flp pilus assembly protein TadG
MSPLHLLRDRIACLVRDRRGVSTLAFAGSAMTLFGAVALATDAGLFYAARRSAQNAADAGAQAAVMSLSLSGRDMAIAAGRDIATRNGFTNGVAGTTVAVNIPPLSGGRTTDGNAVEVVVRQTQTMGTSALFMSTAPTVQGRAVATLRSSSNVCILALTGPVTAGGNVAVNTPNCVIASNARGDGSITINGTSLSLRAFTLAAVGTCVNCGITPVVLTERFREWQAPSDNPFRHLDSKTMPPLGLNPVNGPSLNNGTVQPFESNGRRVIQGSVRITGNQSLTLLPGTYYIWNGDFSVQSGTVNCPTCTGTAGVTIVLTGDPGTIGDFDVNAVATVNLRAPAAPADTDFRGVLFYRDARATRNSTSNPPARLNGSGTVSLSGGLYFPNAHARINGNNSTLACSVIVAGSIDFTGNADVTGCAALGTPLPRTRAVINFE